MVCGEVLQMFCTMHPRRCIQWAAPSAPLLYRVHFLFFKKKKPKRDRIKRLSDVPDDTNLWQRPAAEGYVSLQSFKEPLTHGHKTLTKARSSIRRRGEAGCLAACWLISVSGRSTHTHTHSLTPDTAFVPFSNIASTLE